MTIIRLLIVVGVLFICAIFPYIRCVVFHPVSCALYGLSDLYKYIRYRQWNDAEKTVGEISCFSGLFGEGKTLDEVHFVTRLYNRYNGKKVFKDKSWKIQNVFVLANIELKSIPYIHFTNMQQLVDICDDIAERDKDGKSYSIVYVIIDEMQNVMNSRNFKSNFSSGSDVMRTLTQLRKLKCSIWYTSTRFNQTDAFIRQDTMYVYQVHKVWRLQGYKKYDAWDVENASNLTLVKPVSMNCWFIRNRDFKAYDTHALATQIESDLKSGNMLSQEERIIELSAVGSDYVPTHPSRKFKKLHKAK